MKAYTAAIRALSADEDPSKYSEIAHEQTRRFE